MAKPKANGGKKRMSRIVDKLRQEFEEHKDKLTVMPEDRHFDHLWSTRMERAEDTAEERLPSDSPELKLIRWHLEECDELMTKGLKRKAKDKESEA